MTSVVELYALQELDLELAADRATLEDIQARLGESEALEVARHFVDEKREALRAEEKQFKEREFEADELRAKIEPVEERLYKGQIQNPKELEDLQQDLDSLKRRRSDLEDRALEAMDALEAAQSALGAAQQALEELTESDSAEQQELREQLSGLEQSVASLEARRAEQVIRVDPELLNLYDDLVKSLRGRAVAKVEGGACQGCRISLPTNVLQRARAGGGLVRCSSCDRILYVS